MKATYEFFNNDSKWEKAKIDTDDLDNDSGSEWTEFDLKYYIKESHRQNQELVRNIRLM